MTTQTISLTAEKVELTFLKSQRHKTKIRLCTELLMISYCIVLLI